jgi:hypothetical protein
MEQNSSSGVADSASYSAEYGDNNTNTSVTRMGGRRHRGSYRAGQMGHMSSRAGGRRHRGSYRAGQMGHMSSRAGGRKRKARKTRKAYRRR